MRRAAVLVILLMLCASMSSATPLPSLTATVTPTPSLLNGVVLQPGPAGLVPAANVPVTADYINTTTDSSGNFQLAVGLGSPPVLFTATVQEVPLQTLVIYTSPVTIDPVSEAGVELLDAAGLDPLAPAFSAFAPAGVAAVLAAVRVANQATDFSGLSVLAAVSLARTVAAGDAGVQEAIRSNVFTPTPTWTGTSTATPSVTPTSTDTPLPTATPRPCVGDCGGTGSVTVVDLIRGVNIALNAASVDSCPSFDANGDGTVSVDEIVLAVANALNGCMPPEPLPDLVVTDLRFNPPGGCGPLQLVMDVCVANVGDAPAGPFAVSLNDGQDQFTLEGLAAGEAQCIERPHIGGMVKVVVDPSNAVAEGRESNNTATFEVADPTPPLTCTPTLTPTQSPSPTPT